MTRPVARKRSRPDPERRSRRSAAARIGRFLVGILLLPLCAAAVQTVLSLLRLPEANPPGAEWGASWALMGGFGLWVAAFLALPRPVRTYILAHELTHALWGSVMGATVSRMRISSDSGSVSLSKTNALITLAPYFFPLYTVLVILVYYGLAIFIDVAHWHLWWLGLVGLTWGFHVTFTVTTLLQRQSDVEECGHLFSYGLVFLLNVLGVGLWVVLISAVSLEQMILILAGHVGSNTALAANGVARLARELYNKGWRCPL